MKKIIIWLITFYRRNISGMKKSSCCRFTPTCSQYAFEAVETHGALKGSLLAMKRLLKCNPLFKGGYDPVPPKRHGKINEHIA